MCSFSTVCLVSVLCCVVLQVAVHTPPGHIEQASFALHVAKVVLEYYETFFGVQYPLQKLGRCKETWYFGHFFFYSCIFMYFV